MTTSTYGQHPDNPSTQVRVAVVTTSFPAVEGSSSGVFIERLVAHLPAAIAATVLVPCPDNHLNLRHSPHYHLTCFVYGPRAWLRLAHRPGGIPEALRRRDPALLLLPIFLPAMFLACLRLAGKVDLVHGNWSVPGVIAALAARLRHKPSVTTLRGNDVTRAARSRLFQWLLNACLSLNRYTVVVSEVMQADLRQRYPKRADRILFIPNGVDLADAMAHPPFHSPLRLLTVGSLIRRKRMDTLLDALSHLQSYAEARLRIVGDGPESSDLRKQVSRLGLADRVELLGAVPPAEVSQHLSWADIFIFSSASEGRPNAVLEAMAAALPIVATDIPGVRELIAPDAGLLFPMGDAEALANGIRALIADPGHARDLARSARSKIEHSDLTWATAARRYTALYADVLRRHGPRSCAD